MTKLSSIFIFAAFVFAGLSAHASEAPVITCTSNSPKIERMTVIYAEANVHGELSYTHYLDIVDVDGTTSRLWIENAEVATDTTFAGRFKDFDSKAEVMLKVDSMGKLIQNSQVILNGETIPATCEFYDGSSANSSF